MGLIDKFIPRNDRYASLILYGMVFSTCFNGYDAGIMTVILADKEFNTYYAVDATRRGVIATIPWASTGGFRVCCILLCERQTNPFDDQALLNCALGGVWLAW